MRQTDGRAITNPENAQNFSHAEIKQAADQMNPGGLDGAFDAWATIAAAVTKAGEQFETAIQQAVDKHWEGAAADQAVRGIRDYAERVGELGESLDQQSAPLSAAAGAAARFKVAVPPVVDSSGNPRGPQTRNTQEEQARDDMSTLYIEPYGTTAPAIPTLPPPVNPISAPPGTVLGAVPSGDFGISPTTENGNGTGQPGPSGRSDEGKPGDRNTTAGPSSTDEPSSANDPKADEPGKSEEVVPQAVSPTQPGAVPTTPAATTTHSSAPTVPATTPQPVPTAVIPAGVTPSRSSTSTAGRPPTTPTPSGTPTPGGAPTASGTPTPGRSVPGQQGTVPGAAGPQPAPAPARVGATVAAGHSSMFPPVARSRREDDHEHKSAKYLRTEEHAEELIGKVEPTVPPVFGEK